jgi:hypothetical protein
MTPPSFAAALTAHLPAKTVGSEGKRLPLLIAPLLALLTPCLLLSAAPASAAPTTIAGWGHSAGKVNGPFGSAVDQSSGDFYVADSLNLRVSKFNSAGTFLLAWGYGVASGDNEDPLQVCGPGAPLPTKRCFGFEKAGSGDNSLPAQSVAVDRSSGDVYVSGYRRVYKFTPAGQLIYVVGRNVNKTKGEEEGATQAEKDFCAATSGDVCRGGKGDSGTGSNEFTGAVMPLAIGSSGTVWVGDNNRLASFSSTGAPGAEIALPGAGSTNSLALDSAGDFYLKSDLLPGIRKLEGGSGTLLETIDGAGHARTVTLDEAGHVYVGDGAFGTTYVFKVYDSAGEQFSQFGAGQVIGLPGGGGSASGSNAIAVGEGAAELYVASSRGANDTASPAQKAEVAVQAFPLPEPGPLPEAQRAEDLQPTGAILAARLNPEGHQTTYRFEYDTTPYEGEAGHGTPVPVPDGTLPGEGFDPEALEAPLEGLVPATTYHFRLCATNSKGHVCGEDTSFATPAAVGIEAQWASDISARSATLNATLDARGVPARWRLEYDTSPYAEGEAGHGTRLPVPDGSLPAGEGAVPVSAALAGLEPATTYHYRFVAVDERPTCEAGKCVVDGPERTFATQPAALGFSLPDSRAWEMVTPPDKRGALISPNQGTQGGQVQGAANGEALAYLTLGSIEANPQGNRLIEQSSALARRGAGGRWSSQDISPPHTEVTPVSVGEGLEYKLFSSDLERALLRPFDATPLSPAAAGPTSYLRGNASPPTYTPLGAGSSIVGASPDLRHVVIGLPAPVPGLYEWTGGSLAPVSVKPAGEGGVTVGAKLGSGTRSVRGAVSEDGSRVFFSPVSGGGLYVRDLARGETARLDEVQEGGFGTGAAEPVFQAASADGRFAFFTDTQNLTGDSGEEGADLYRCAVVVREGHLTCELSDLSAQTAVFGEPQFGESAFVQGLVPGIDEVDGSAAYFVAHGVLDPAPNGEGQSAAPGEPNLYLWREGDGVRFIAALAAEDERDWGVRDGNAAAAFAQSAATSPNGRYLAFMSESPLTGYDNRSVGSAARAQEIFLYDSATGELACASCNPSGARPATLQGGEKPSLVEFDPQELWGGHTLAAALPEATSLTDGGPSLYRPRAVHDDGRLFFNAADTLVPADSNGNWDVYEYEPTGVGGCGGAAGGPATALAGGACVSLISSGTGAEEAAFLDASESGDDAFFYSPARLSVQDEDEVNDVYDARVGGEPAVRQEVTECQGQGEACQPPASPPALQTPSSASFRGPGNLREATASRCAGPVRRARRFSRRARKLRRTARRIVRRSSNLRRARLLNHRARRLAHRAQGTSKRARRCRRAGRSGSR